MLSCNYFSQAKFDFLSLHEHEWPALFYKVKDEMADRFPIVITETLEELKTASLILGASNSNQSIIKPEHLGNTDIVICDIALPPDIDDAVAIARPDVTVIKGGIIGLPENPEFKIGGIDIPKGTAYACMSETILLGLSELKENYSYGAINAAKVKKIYKLGKEHGFKIKLSKFKQSL